VFGQNRVVVGCGSPQWSQIGSGTWVLLGWLAWLVVA